MQTNRTERVAAAFINAVMGTLPVSMPYVTCVYGDFGVWWLGNDLLLYVLAYLFAIVQVCVAYKMQGSIGYVCMGLRVQAVSC
jgi:uncharacterized RDD family membrane protein YckC